MSSSIAPGQTETPGDTWARLREVLSFASCPAWGRRLCLSPPPSLRPLSRKAIRKTSVTRRRACPEQVPHTCSHCHYLQGSPREKPSEGGTPAGTVWPASCLCSSARHCLYWVSAALTPLPATAPPLCPGGAGGGGVSLRVSKAEEGPCHHLSPQCVLGSLQAGRGASFGGQQGTRNVGVYFNSLCDLQV